MFKIRIFQRFTKPDFKRYSLAHPVVDKIDGSFMIFDQPSDKKKAETGTFSIFGTYIATEYVIAKSFTLRKRRLQVVGIDSCSGVAIPGNNMGGCFARVVDTYYNLSPMFHFSIFKGINTIQK